MIDNAPTTAQMDANAAMEVAEKTVTVELNRPFTLLFARTLKPGTDDLENYEDDAVEFWQEGLRDPNMADSWGSVPEQARADPNMPEDFQQSGLHPSVLDRRQHGADAGSDLSVRSGPPGHPDGRR
ncbi:MAG: hypothetical protein MZV65_28985 [Chromatiales bacterium]|nr:hypothetical protein [Chromatiales bacterium]